MVRLTWFDPSSGQFLETWIRRHLIQAVCAVVPGKVPDGVNATVVIAPEARIPQVADYFMFVAESKEQIIGELREIERYAEDAPAPEGW